MRHAEDIPPCCPSGHPWGPPVGGRVRVVVGHHPCGGPRGHRTWHCETPDCPTPWVRRGWCERRGADDPVMWTWDPDDLAHHTRPDPSPAAPGDR